MDVMGAVGLILSLIGLVIALYQWWQSSRDNADLRSRLDKLATNVERIVGATVERDTNGAPTGEVWLSGTSHGSSTDTGVLTVE